MAWNIPGTATTGNPIPASFGNDIIGNFDILETQIGLYGTAGYLNGTPASLGAPNFLVQAGTTGAETDSSGHLAVTFPNAFPTSLISLTVTPMFGLPSGIGAYAGNWWAIPYNSGTNGFDLNCIDFSGGALESAVVGVSWVAYGS